MEEWKKERDLGAGGFGVVSLWRNTVNNRLLALKCCRSDGDCLDIKSKTNWCREVDKMGKLSHPNIIRVLPVPLALAQLSQLPILCMEFCSKGDLRKELFKVDNICGLPEESVRAVLRDVKAGIQYLHSVSIVHRDLKPENIVIHEVPDPDQPNNATKIVYKLIDLGFAKEWDQNSLCSTFVGTLQYIAPEVFTVEPSYRSSVDYWSFGLVCHEVVTGFRPFLPSMTPHKWVEHVKRKEHDHICIYETVNGIVEYSREIFPENHITQPFKYALEAWLRIALEWDGNKRGWSSSQNSLVIFSSLEAALNIKIVTVYCVRRFERLSYEIEESTLAQTLKHWVHRDTGITPSDQLLLLPSGSVLEDHGLIHTQIDNDPKLVAMLYLISREEGVRLPSLDLLQSRHPVLVRRVLESPSSRLPYAIVRRTWANSVFFVQSVLESYRAFIEAYSVKMLYLLNLERELSGIRRALDSALISLQSKLTLSQSSLKIDSQNVRSNQLHGISRNNEIGKDKEWESPYRTIEGDLKRLRAETIVVSNKLEPQLQKMSQLQKFEEPGQSLCDELTHLLNEGRSLYSGLIRLPQDKRDQPRDSSAMVQIIFQLWKTMQRITKDQTFSEHLEELAVTEAGAVDLRNEMKGVEKEIVNQERTVCEIHCGRQREIWSMVKNVPSNDNPPMLPPRNNIDMGTDWSIM